MSPPRAAQRTRPEAALREATLREATLPEAAFPEAAVASPTRAFRDAPPRRLAFARARVVAPALDALLARADRAARLEHDPLGLVHRYDAADDRELVGLLASAVAYGRVSLFRPRLAALLASLGSRPAAFAREASASEVLRATRSFSYRMTGPADLGALLFAAGRAQRAFGSLGTLARRCFDLEGARLRPALDRFVATVWSADLRPFVGQRTLTRRLSHLLSSPAQGSACKRLNLYLRWMTRGPDGVDFGQWDLPTSTLVIPLDTHVHRISRLLGLTRRQDLSWRTAEEITARLRHLDPEDPVKYDFALAHLGISGDCPARAVQARCAACPLRPICRVWDRLRD